MWILGAVHLTAMACVGLAAGPSFFSGSKKSGIGHVFVGSCDRGISAHRAHLVRPLCLMKMNPVILLGACWRGKRVGRCCSARHSRRRSELPALGYTVPYAEFRQYPPLRPMGPVLVAMMSSFTNPASHDDSPIR